MVKKINLKNKVIIITGGSSGLGLTISDYLINKKMKVAICARNVSNLKKKYRNFNQVFIKKVDISKENQISKFVHEVKNKFKKIDFLINNAGFLKPDKIENINHKSLEYTFKVNLYAPVIFIKLVSRFMKHQNFGRIINISSGGSVNCVQGYFAYSASKAAINTLTKTASKEFKKFNIKVNSMSPGPCKTKMFPLNKLSTTLSMPTVEYLLTNSKKENTGNFYWFKKKIIIIPDLSKINWAKPKINNKLR